MNAATITLFSLVSVQFLLIGGLIGHVLKQLPPCVMRGSEIG